MTANDQDESVVPAAGCASGRDAGSWRSKAFLIAIVLAGTVVGLRAEGRRWWCACGQARVWVSDTTSEHCSQHLLDPYALTHVLHGVALCGVFALLLPRRPGLGFLGTICLECFWELVENSSIVIDRYRTATIAKGYTGDSIFNSLGDIAACAMGYWLAKRLGWKWAAVVWIAVELILLFWIRDNLFLNVLMLVWPSEAIRAWQGRP